MVLCHSPAKTQVGKVVEVEAGEEVEAVVVALQTKSHGAGFAWTIQYTSLIVVLSIKQPQKKDRHWRIKVGAQGVAIGSILIRKSVGGFIRHVDIVTKKDCIDPTYVIKQMKNKTLLTQIHDNHSSRHSLQ